MATAIEGKVGYLEISIFNNSKIKLPNFSITK